MGFNDDDEIKSVATGHISADPKTFVEEKIQARVINNTEAPLSQTNFSVMFEVTCAGSGSDRRGLDLVTVLDVSWRKPWKEKEENLKKAMNFIINKLSPIDRLSVVVISKYNGAVNRLSRLSLMTKEFKVAIKALLNAHFRKTDNYIGTGTNIYYALNAAVEILSNRRFKRGRTVAIMLMSDNPRNISTTANYNFANVPAFTFGFGVEHELLAFRTNIGGGTYSDIQSQDDLTRAVAQCLGGLLTVVVEDLEVTFKSVKSTIIRVSAGSYRQVSSGGSVTVSFGNLYIKEVRKVIVELLLYAVTPQSSADILQITYKYKSLEDLDLSDPIPTIVHIRRKGTAVMPEMPEMIFEQYRIKIAQIMKEARLLADQKRLNEARSKLPEAQKLLDNIVADEPNKRTIEMMKYELNELLEAIDSDDLYVKHGRPFALSLETSHELQRYAARGELNYLRMFATPRMDKYLDQVLAFEEDRTKNVPTEEEDVKQELAN